MLIAGHCIATRIYAFVLQTPPREYPFTPLMGRSNLVIYLLAIITVNVDIQMNENVELKLQGAFIGLGFECPSYTERAEIEPTITLMTLHHIIYM